MNLPQLTIRSLSELRQFDLGDGWFLAVNAMLLNEFLKEHQKVQRLEAALAAVNERLKAQDAKIDKVNAKVELAKPAPQVVNNSQ
jgi:predicted PolB exonuclease-like 3'-5' exonuclease